MTEGPYTTITVDAFNHMAAVIRHLRRQVQKGREALEKGQAGEALGILRFEDEAMGKDE